MSRQKLRILSLYPRLLNIYGDVGNLLVLRKRCEWRQISAEIVSFDVGTDPQALEDIDVIVGGGGQDSSQAAVHADIKRIAPGLRHLIEEDTPALLVCGSYQLFGVSLCTALGEELEGLGILDITTVEDTNRHIGNIISESDTFGELLGYENHSGRTLLGTGLAPLARVKSGFGNNGEDGTEGVRYRNLVGTYLHGPILPKNPQIADFLIACGLERRYGEQSELQPLSDNWVVQAREVARSRTR